MAAHSASGTGRTTASAAGVAVGLWVGETVGETVGVGEGLVLWETEGVGAAVVVPMPARDLLAAGAEPDPAEQPAASRRAATAASRAPVVV